MYVPKYLEYLSNSRTADGWPSFVTEEGKELATNVARFLLRRSIPTTIDEVVDGIFLYYKAAVPDCFKGAALIDARYAVAHRALLAAGGSQTWTKGQL